MTTGVGRARAGAALPFVLGALVVGAVSAAGVVAVAREVGRGARADLAAHEAASAADGALALVVARWPGRWAAELAPGVRTVRDVATPAGLARVAVVRLDAPGVDGVAADGARFAVEAEARSVGRASPADGPAVRRRLLLVRLPRAAPAVAAALTAAAAVQVADGASVRGADHLPAGWTECAAAAGDALATAVAAPDVSPAPGAVIDGIVATDSAAWRGAADPRFGVADYAAYAARAHVTIEGVGTLSPAPAASGAAVVPGALDAEPCALTSGSWGEPLRGAGAVAACVGARPLVHVRGAATRLVGPARFQGTLLVDGDLVVEGAVRGAGIVVVRGGVDATAGMLVLDGALVAGGPVRLGGGSEVRASRCAVAAAAGYTARPVPLTRRAWAEVLR